MLKNIYNFSSLFIHNICESLVSVSNTDENKYIDILCEKFYTSDSFIEPVDISKNLYTVYTIDGFQTTVLVYDKTDESEFITNYVDKKTKETVNRIKKVKIKDIDYLNFSDFLDNASLNKNIYNNTSLEKIINTIWPDVIIYDKDDKYTIFKL